MSAQSINSQGFYYGINSTLNFLGPGQPGYFLSQTTDVATLSDSGVMAASAINAALWAPTLLAADSTLCDNETTTIPQGVAEGSSKVAQYLSSAQGMPYLIAFAPWASTPECQFAYFRAANASNVQAYITYVPGPANDPPPQTAQDWNLQDGDDWKRVFEFPVYALSGALGAQYLDALVNSTQGRGLMGGVLYGVQSQINMQNSSSWAVLPDLWTIVLAVLAAFVAILAGVSGVLHLLQRKRRRDLRRRIMTGEVSLEDIGIRKLTVPQTLMDKMPVRKYSSLAGQDSTASAYAPEKTNATASKSADIAPAMAHSYNQPTCPICLDDFSSASDVRCLPCDHIFHPECCDSFLLENSSLCPMCKKSVLPKGYCPEKITNAMVRRERLARLREAEERAGQDPTLSTQPSSSWHLSARMRNALQSQGGNQPLQSSSSAAAAAADSAMAPQALEMQPQTPAPGTSQDASSTMPPPPAVSQAPGRPAPGQDCSPGRREWARRRALQLLGPQAQADAVIDEDRVRQASVPRWRRAVAKVFPSSAS